MRVVAVIGRHEGVGCEPTLREWAVQQALRRLGFNPVTVDYRVGCDGVDGHGNACGEGPSGSSVDGEGFGGTLGCDEAEARRGRDGAAAGLRGCGVERRMMRRRAHELLRADRERLIELTPPVEALDAAPQVDAYLACGSRVWEAEPEGRVDPALLWAGVDRGPGRRIAAYAAGFGRRGLDAMHRADAVRLLSRFDAVSACDEDGRHALERLGIRADRVVDPMLLLSGREWAGLAGGASTRRRSYALACWRGPEPTAAKGAAARFAGKGLDVVDVSLSGAIVPPASRRSARFAARFESGFATSKASRLRLGPTLVAPPTTTELVVLVARAERVLTDSPCVAALCLCLEVPFAAFACGDEGVRLREALGRYGLAHLVFDGLDGDAALARRIDWRRTRSQLAADRERSLEWLRRALESQRHGECRSRQFFM